MKLMRGTEFSHGMGKEEHGVMLHLCLVQQGQGLDERSTHSGDVIIHCPNASHKFFGAGLQSCLRWHQASFSVFASRRLSTQHRLGPGI